MRVSRAIRVTLCLALVALWAAGPACRAADGAILIKNGEKIAFLGDSITQGGWNRKDGYVHLVMEGLKESGVQAEAIPAGISGSNSRSELARLDKDVIGKKPNWMLVSCGVNDVWGLMKLDVPLPEFKTNMTAIVGKAQAAGIKVMVFTTTMIGEDPKDDRNRRAVPYNEFLRALAAEKKCPLADLNAEAWAALEAPDTPRDGFPGGRLSEDGVHMYPRGNVVMACGVLKALGVPADQVAKLRQTWLTRSDLMVIDASVSPALNHSYHISKAVSVVQFERIAATAAKSNRKVGHLTGALVEADFKTVLLKPSGEFDTVLQSMESPRQPELEKQLNALFDQQLDTLLSAKTLDEGAALLEQMLEPLRKK